MDRRVGALLALLIAAPAGAAEAPVTFHQLHTDIDVQADGRFVATIRFEIRAGNDGAANGIAQQTLSYIDKLEHVDLLEGYTLKQDGRRIPLAEGAVRTQLVPGSISMPEYVDSKRVVAVFPDVHGGDTIVVVWRKTVDQPIFPGNFAWTSLFGRTFPWDDVRIRITVPAGRPLKTEVFGPAVTSSENGGTRTYEFTYHADPVSEDRSVIAAVDRVPRLFASTFTDWSAFGDAWAALVEPKLAPTPQIQRLADEVTHGIDDRRGQAEALYAYVSRHVRWVAIYVGNGPWVPHPAANVLANGYGDCKDQVTLMLALLRAKGIVGEPALIHFGSTYRLSGPATMTAFNHVITYIPEFDLYADTTSRGAPFGTIPAALYGKPALHVRLDHSEVGRTPVLPPRLATMRMRTEARLDEAGQVTGTTETQAAGPYATVLRSKAEQMQSQGTERAAAEQLRTLGEAGTGDVSTGPLDRVGADYAVTGRFTLIPQPGWLKGDAFMMPTGLRLLPRPGDGTLGMLGQRSLPISEPTPCYAGEQREELSLILPPGRRLDRLPLDRGVDTPDFTYHTHWTQVDGTVSVTRSLSSRIQQPLCEGVLRETAEKALEEIRRDLAVRIALTED